MNVTPEARPGARSPESDGPVGQEASTRARVDFQVVPRRKWGQMTTAVVAIAFAVMTLIILWDNPNIDHATIVEYFASAPIMEGLLTTLQLTAVAAVVGWVVGIVVALMRMSSNRVLQAFAWFYVWALRSTPLLVQLLFWGYFGLLFKNIVIGIPFTDVRFFSVDTNTIFTAFVASVLGLGLNASAYQAEIVRGGILAVDRGQFDAATGLGLTPFQTMRRVVLPQAMRVIIPPTGNEFINLLKSTSLVSVIAGGDLLTNAQNIGAISFRTIEMLMIATFWYFVIVSIANIGQHILERRVGRGYSH